MARLDATTVFRAVLGCFVAAPVGYALIAPLAPPGPAGSIAYGLPAAALVGLGGALWAVRRAIAPRRLARALVALYIATFAALVAIQTVASATVGWIRGPWAGYAALAIGALVAYAVALRSSMT
ncbi:hypothetical protein MBEHAL_0958 [Halarchaeum acidiphilum MH1-52-1]|uniref:Uncharacterized protein n=2 Tax=Halarchaeum acidiphilum TaxID=489138 RepID=U3ABP1_9EURY|nr:hypothetical protein [Halarchaeum acidiphilum]GAD52198.1 hypothetical protein MBEHAL_0958 [Halarchaeum acidiphilum MH1-52-1]